VIPYVLSSANRRLRGRRAQDIDGEVGVDAKFGVTPSLNLDVTVNTDFAQVEVDDQQINLTRFNLFFPEKRPFFLENAGTFGIGTGDSTSRAIEMFFSRRIDRARESSPIQVGARLTERKSAYNVGL
jgi:hypothetical protein